jgi:hypothetical protein
LRLALIQALEEAARLEQQRILGASARGKPISFSMKKKK